MVVEGEWGEVHAAADGGARQTRLVQPEVRVRGQVDRAGVGLRRGVLLY